jgi:ribosomal protein S18 acetylase RimI-like enzyme
VDRAERKRLAHLNLVESWRQLLAIDTGAVIDDSAEALLVAGSHPHPAIANFAFRTDDAADPAAVISSAQEFFGGRDRSFSIWVRGDEPEDEDLVAAAKDAGMNQVYETPEMTADAKVEERELPDAAELRRLDSAGQAGDYWHVTRESYIDLHFPPELFDTYDDDAALLADNIAAFIAYLDDKPVSVAMTVVQKGVAGIYWVGTLEEARGKGLAWATTAAATNAGLDMGGEFASLQASHMGAPLYPKMGYETLFPYRLFMQPAES